MDIEDLQEELESLEPLTEEEDLLYSEVIGPRLFMLNNAAASTLLGIIMEETEDSFLVGFPSKMLKVDETEEYRVDAYVPGPFFRLMKHCVISVMFMVEPFLTPFNEYLESEGPDLYPELLEDLRDTGYELGLDDVGLEEITEELADKLKEANRLGSIIYDTSKFKQ